MERTIIRIISAVVTAAIPLTGITGVVGLIGGGLSFGPASTAGLPLGSPVLAGVALLVFVRWTEHHRAPKLGQTRLPGGGQGDRRVIPVTITKAAPIRRQPSTAVPRCSRGGSCSPTRPSSSSPSLSRSSTDRAWSGCAQPALPDRQNPELRALMALDRLGPRLMAAQRRSDFGNALDVERLSGDRGHPRCREWKGDGRPKSAATGRQGT
jgi:hypothetical protein